MSHIACLFKLSACEFQKIKLFLHFLCEVVPANSFVDMSVSLENLFSVVEENFSETVRPMDLKFSHDHLTYIQVMIAGV